MGLCGDWMMWIKLLLESDISFVAQPLNYWRVHPATTKKFWNSPVWWTEALEILGLVFRTGAISEPSREAVLARFTGQLAQLSLTGNTEFQPAVKSTAAAEVLALINQRLPWHYEKLATRHYTQARRCCQLAYTSSGKRLRWQFKLLQFRLGELGYALSRAAQSLKPKPAPRPAAPRVAK